MDRAKLAPRVNGLKIITGALMSGLIMITGALVFLRTGPGGVPPLAKLEFPLWPIPVVMLVIAVILGSIIGSTIQKNGVKNLRQKRQSPGTNPTPEEFTSGNDSAIFGLISVKHIIKLALIEACGVIGAVLYFLQGNELALIATAGAIFWMAIHFPTTERVLGEYEAIQGQVEES